MLNLLKKEANRTFTENGAVTYATTYSDCLDLFATIGALRRESDAEVIARFDRAYAENALLAMKTIFYARDVRGGLGERRIFRVLLRHIGNTYAASAKKNLELIAEFGRFDDLLALLGTQCESEVLELIKSQFDADMASLDKGEGVSLLGKWLPSVNASSAETVAAGKHVARALGLSNKDYRQTLSRLREAIAIIENSLRERNYSFDYEKQPSNALFKYRKAFDRNDGERYSAFLKAVTEGKAALKTGSLMPYELIKPFFRSTTTEAEQRSINTAWNALEDFTRGENSLVVVDGSGSMYGGGDPLPIAVALSLGIYYGERNRGAFRNHFITFSQSPQLVEIKGRSILEKLRYCASFNDVANTNLQGVFELILSTAVKNHLPQSQLPETLYIISDMEFDYCMTGTDTTNFDRAKALFRRHGYKLPRVVFWNVASRNVQQPVTRNERNVTLVSGASARVFSMLKSGDFTPETYMLEVLNAPRYDKITA